LQPGTSTLLAVDISIHALTKYPSGGGDVLMGSVITRDPALHLQLKLCHMRLGLGVAANDVEAVLRSLPSIKLRYTAHDQATRALAQWCQTRSEFAQVLHPALAHSPGHQHWLSLCKGEPGSAQSVWWCRTRFPACARVGRNTCHAVLWCGFPLDSRRSRICRLIWRRPCIEWPDVTS